MSYMRRHLAASLPRSRVSASVHTTSSPLHTHASMPLAQHLSATSPKQSIFCSRSQSIDIQRRYASTIDPIAVSMPSASINHSDNDPSAFHYESHEGMPVSKFSFPEGRTVDDILAEYAHIDPFAVVAKDLTSFSDTVTEVVHSHHDTMKLVARYLLDAKGKRFRPTVVLLMSRALGTPAAPLPISDANINGDATHTYSIDTPLSPGLSLLERDVNGHVDVYPSCSSAPSSYPFPSIASYVSPSSMQKQSPTDYAAIESTQVFSTTAAVISNMPISTTFQRQQRLSEITELIHVASLYHDDVVDEATTRRNRPSANMVYGNKLAVYGGVFLLSRASCLLCKLQNHGVTALIATVMDQLVKGEVLQMKDKRANVQGQLHSNLTAYITKTYYKTASLIANSCQAAAILGGHGITEQTIAYEYGKFLGIAFQVVDDIIDFTSSSEELGKPAMNDLRQGLATAPVLYAAEEFPELYTMIERKFSQPGDVEAAVELIHRARGLEKARELAVACCYNALAAIMQLPESDARAALVRLVHKVLYRKK